MPVPHGMSTAPSTQREKIVHMSAPTATNLLDILERSLHQSETEWLFLRELRVGTGRLASSNQRLDALALNCYPHLGMKRVCYEVKTSRADYLCELKHPVKRRIGMRYSNEFYFVVPGGLLQHSEIPSECGLIEAGNATLDEWRQLIKRRAGFFNFDPDTGEYCMVTIPAPWRDTPGPTWQLVAAMLRNQRRQLEDHPPVPRPQQKLEFE
jgi:hypothetical protein